MNELRPELKHAAENLGRTLKNTPPLCAYAAALAGMEADQSATTLLDELQQTQADIRVRQANGSVTAEEIAHLRQLQNSVQTHPTIATFLEAESRAMTYLPQVNQEISRLLGIDFASLGRVNGCC